MNKANEVLPPGSWDIWVRSYATAYKQKNLDHWEKNRWKFAVSAYMSPQIKEAVPAESWGLIEDKGGVIQEWAEVEYVPSKKNDKKDAEPYRYVAVRLRRQQEELFGDGVPVRHFAVVSNIWDMDGKALLEWYRGRAGTIDHVHHILKGELDGGVYPSGKHGTNAAWLRLQVKTHSWQSRSVGLSGNTKRWGS